MNNRVSIHFPLIIAAILAAATFWLERVVNNETPGSKSNLRHDPDLIAEGITIDRFNPQGKHITHITSERIQHYPDDDTADMTKPVVTFMREEPPAVFSSDTAHAENTTKVVTMNGHVKGDRAALEQSPAMSLRTDTLTVLTDDEIAKTSQPVVLTRGTATITGVGMEWNNLTGIFKINSHARTTFQPKTHHDTTKP